MSKDAVAPDLVERLVDEGKYKRGDTVRCEYDGFVGTILAPYVTREGRKGWVVQMLSTKVVHVYGEDRLLLVQPLAEVARLRPAAEEVKP